MNIYKHARPKKIIKVRQCSVVSVGMGTPVEIIIRDLMTWGEEITELF